MARFNEFDYLIGDGFTDEREEEMAAQEEADSFCDGDFDGAPMDPNWQDYADEDSAEDDPYGHEFDDVSQGHYDDDPSPYSGQ